MKGNIILKEYKDYCLINKLEKNKETIERFVNSQHKNYYNKKTLIDYIDNKIKNYTYHNKWKKNNTKSITLYFNLNNEQKEYEELNKYKKETNKTFKQILMQGIKKIIN